MKRLYYIATLIAALFLVMPLQAQEDNNETTTQQNKRRSPQASRGERVKKEKETGLPELTIRAQELNDRMTQQIGNARWMRIIYRQIDLTKEENAPLYYPIQPMNGQMNLFSTIFQLVSEGKLAVYEYMDGYEDFSDAYKVKLKDMLDRFHILYEEVQPKGSKQTVYVVNEADVPSADVKSYYVKEAWYFDQNNSVFDVKTLAICPILTDNGEIGETTMGMFWIPYEKLRPYVMSSYIMTSNSNNVMSCTVDDYFRRRMFKGDIIKTQNLLNQPLHAYCLTPDSLKREQKNIENQLTTFESSLWMHPDSMKYEVEEKAVKKVKKANVEKKTSKSEGAKKVKKSAPKVEKSAPVRSVRRRR